MTNGIARALLRKPAKLLFSLIIGLVTTAYLPVHVQAQDPLDMVLGSEGSTPWNVANIKPGDSGTKVVSLHNAGTIDGMVTIWISNLVSFNGSVTDPKFAGSSAKLSDYLLLDLSSSGLEVNVPLPTIVTDFPQEPSGLHYVRVKPVRAGETVNLTWTWKLPSGTGNNVQGKGVSFSLNYLLEELPSGLLAETSISQALSSNVTGVVAVKVNINRIKNQADNSTAAIPGGIGSYSVAISGSPASAIQFPAVNGISPFIGPSFNATTGVFSVANVTSPIQANSTVVAEVVPILTGNTSTSITLTIAFQTIGAAGQPGLNVPEEYSNTITLRRGNVKDNDTVVDIFDALYIVQYIVGQRQLSGTNALAAASVRHDGASGDKIDIFDALFIAQYIVGQKNHYFQ